MMDPFHDGEEPMVTKSGKVLTDADVQAFADEAERGYDITNIDMEPRVYPVCAACRRPWQLRRAHAVWAWVPDCDHKTTGCMLTMTRRVT